MSSHRAHRERMPPLHMTQTQPHSTHIVPQQAQMPHANGVVHHPHSSHPSPAMSNGHSAHPQQLAGQMISPSQAAHPNPNPVMTHLNTHSPAIPKLAKANEDTWLLIGEVAEQMNNLDLALTAYEHALRHNPRCVPALSQVAGIARIKENYPKAIEYFQRVVSLPSHEVNGEIWSALGHCYLMQDELQKAYSAYQQALYHLPNPKEDPKLWYGIGILYDRYGSLDHAEEAFASVLRMDKDFDKANEILFRLGIIYKQQGKYESSLECFDRILRSPPSPLAHVDIWFQIGHVYEQQKDFVRAKDAYERVVAENPTHAKVLQQLGWLYHQQGAPFQNQELAIQYLTKSLEADPSDAQSWYLLGRAYMAGQKYNKAYEAYQQAVYRDGRNPTFWCSIGVLYFQINQYRDALDAYSRAIRINPYISEVWFDLGSLYESCNNQISDAIDAYGRAAELDPYNPHIKQRLELLKNVQENGGQLPTAPGPQDVHPTAYATAAGPPGIPGPGAQPMVPGGPGHPGPTGGRLLFRSDSRGSNDHASLPGLPPPPPQGRRNSPGPFKGGAPPPVVIDETRRPPQHNQLAPMDVDRTTASSRPSVGLLLQQPQTGSGHSILPGPSEFSNRRINSPSVSPPHGQPRSPGYAGGNTAYHDHPAYNATSPTQASPRTYPIVHHEMNAPPHVERSRDERGKDRERARDLPGREKYNSQPGSHHRAFDGNTSGESPAETIRQIGGEDGAMPQWRQQLHTLPPMEREPIHPTESSSRRYDPLYHDRSSRTSNSEAERSLVLDRKIDLSPEVYRNQLKTHPGISQRQSSVSPNGDQRKKSRTKDKDRDGEHSESKSQRRKKNSIPSKRPREDPGESTRARGSPVLEQSTPTSSRGGVAKQESPDDKSVSSRGSGQTKHPETISPIPRVAQRPVDEDYDEGVAETLIGLASQRPSDQLASRPNGSRSSIIPSAEQRMHTPISHNVDRDTIMQSPPQSTDSSSLKRPLSPGIPDPKDTKRLRTDTAASRSPSPPEQRESPSAVSRPSPIPFRVQASPEIFRSAEMDKERSSIAPSSRDSHSPSLPQGSGPPSIAPHRSSPPSSNQPSVTLPPIATISSPRESTSGEEAPMPDSKIQAKLSSTVEHASPQASTPMSTTSSKRASVAPGDESNVGTVTSPRESP